MTTLRTLIILLFFVLLAAINVAITVAPRP